MGEVAGSIGAEKSARRKRTIAERISAMERVARNHERRAAEARARITNLRDEQRALARRIVAEVEATEKDQS